MTSKREFIPKTFSKEAQKCFNDQINKELEASYIYQSIVY